MKIYQTALVIASLILGSFSLVISNAYFYLGQITNEIENESTSSVWGFVGLEFFALAFILAIVFVIRSSKK